MCIELFRNTISVNNLWTVVGIVLFIFSIYVNRGAIKVHYIAFILIIIGIFSLTLIDKQINIYEKNYFLAFLLGGAIAGYNITHNISINKIIVNIANLGCILMPISIVVGVVTNIPTQLMGLSYGMLPIILSYIILILDKHLKVKKLNKYIYAFNLIMYFVFVLIRGSRGTIVAFLVFIVIYILINIKRKGFRGIVLLIGTIFAGVGIAYIDVLLINLEKMLNVVNIRLEWLERSIIQLQNNDLLTGRGWLYGIAQDMIRNWDGGI